MSCTKSGIWPLLYYSSSVCVLHFNVVSFVFSYIWVWIHITIRRVTVLFYPKFMGLVLMLYLLFSLILSIDLRVLNSGILLMPLFSCWSNWLFIAMRVMSTNLCHLISLFCNLNSLLKIPSVLMASLYYNPG